MSEASLRIAFDKSTDEQSGDIVSYKLALVTAGTVPAAEDYIGEGEYDANGSTEFDLASVEAWRQFDGTYEVYVVNVDDAGLWSEPASMELTIDFVKPSRPVNLRLA